jgi:hypothetical protein
MIPVDIQVKVKELNDLLELGFENFDEIEASEKLDSILSSLEYIKHWLISQLLIQVLNGKKND